MNTQVVAVNITDITGIGIEVHTPHPQGLIYQNIQGGGAESYKAQRLEYYDNTNKQKQISTKLEIEY